jgi:uncharacterized protein YciI
LELKMIFVNYLQYGERERILELRPAHQKYLFGLLEQGKLVAAGSFPEDVGGLYLYETDSQEAAELLMASDPYVQGNAIASFRITAWEVHGVNPDLLRISKKTS